MTHAEVLNFFADELTCFVCLEQFTDVVFSIPCATQLHNICGTCWKTYLSKTKKMSILRCPKCRHDINKYRHIPLPQCEIIMKMIEYQEVTTVCNTKVMKRNLGAH